MAVNVGAKAHLRSIWRKVRGRTRRAVQQAEPYISATTQR